MKPKLIISETFYSIQGEGPSAGIPSVFLRTTGCNLRCEGFTYQHPDTKKHLGCDTKAVWTKGEKYTNSEILKIWEKENWLEHLKNGAHLVITGGEPLLQQTRLIDFIFELDQKLKMNSFIEIETNGTQGLLQSIQNRINQFNVSPKLENSGETKSKAYNKNILKQFSDDEKSIFKFVVQYPDDIQEIIFDYMEPFNIEPNRIWLMPEGGTREKIQEKAAWIIELCKEYHVNYTPRLQVDIWNEVTGV